MMKGKMYLKVKSESYCRYGRVRQTVKLRHRLIHVRVVLLCNDRLFHFFHNPVDFSVDPQQRDLSEVRGQGEIESARRLVVSQKCLNEFSVLSPCTVVVTLQIRIKLGCTGHVHMYLEFSEFSLKVEIKQIFFRKASEWTSSQD